MQRNILTGSEFLLYNIDNEPVAYCTNSAIKINNSLIDVTTKSSDSWSESMVGIKDWNIEFEGLVSYGDDFNTSYFVNKFQNSEPFFIRFGVLQDNFTHAFYGEVHIESIDQAADDGELVSYSGSLKGIGNLSFTDSGSPEQSGYIRTETDPVFRGSAAYNITDADKAKWNAANDKIVKEIQFITEADVATLKLKFKDGNQYSTSFQIPQPVIDLSGFYTKSQADALISNAQTAADTANQLLYNIANDNKLTPSEKLNVLKEWQIIEDEKPKILEQAAQYSLITIDYEVSFNELELYLEPLLLSVLITSNIEGFELRNYFRAYYDQRIILMKNINDAKINNIKIGSRNYHLNGERIITISQTANQTIQSGNYPINSDLGLSFYARSIDPSNTLYLQFDNSESKEFVVTSGWTRYTAVTKSLDNPIFYGRVLTSLSDSTSITSGFPYEFPAKFGAVALSGVQLKNIMVVEGNKVLDYSPAPEDYFSTITKNNNAIIASATTVVNVANTTTLLLAKNESIAQAEAAKQAAILSASGFTLAQKELAEINANTYADGIVTEEEQARIIQAENNLQAAKVDATNKANSAAAYGINATNLHNALVSNLKEMAFTDIQEVGNSGVTVVKNGNVMTFSLQAEYVQSSIVNTEYLESLDIVSKKIRTAESGKRVEMMNDNTIKFYISDEVNPVVVVDDDLIDEDTSTTPAIKGPGIMVGDINKEAAGYVRIGRKNTQISHNLSVQGQTNVYPLYHGGRKMTYYKFLSASQIYDVTDQDYIIFVDNSCEVNVKSDQNYDGREIKISTCYASTTTRFWCGGKWIHGVGGLDGTAINLPADGVYSFLVTGSVVVAI